MIPLLTYSALTSLPVSFSTFRSQPKGHLLREAALSTLSNGVPLSPFHLDAMTTLCFVSVMVLPRSLSSLVYLFLAALLSAVPTGSKILVRRDLAFLSAAMSPSG